MRLARSRLTALPGRFQLTHSRGVRRRRQAVFQCGYDFNSRTHVECDLICILLSVILFSFQLTHSRGVRHTFTPDFSIHSDFNSRTHVECDRFSAAGTYVPADFNSRTHVECDTRCITNPNAADNFNSRTHVECDFSSLNDSALFIISTHALTWSATCILGRIGGDNLNFNSRTHVECDWC